MSVFKIASLWTTVSIRPWCSRLTWRLSPCTLWVIFAV